jgi:hypothetical protein
MTSTLTDLDVAVLDLERAFWLYPGEKEAAIRARVDMTAVAFYQRLNAMLDRQDVLAHDPLLVKRLRRRREHGVRRRALARPVD